MNPSIEQQIEVMVRARYPILYVVSWEEPRVIDTLLAIGRRTNKAVFEWSCSSGIVPAGKLKDGAGGKSASTRDPLAALNEVIEQVEPAIYIFKDFHPFLARNNFAIIRRLRDIAQILKSSYKTLILTSPFLDLPRELEKDVTVIDFHLPAAEEIGVLLDRIVDEVKDNPKIEVSINAAGREEIVKAALGLTLAEAENVFARALITGGRLCNEDVSAIFAEKRQIIRKSGLLDYCEPEIGIKQVGGLENLKEWLVKRRTAFSDKARKFGLPSPAGVLLLGVQGCGKSMCAKAVSSVWNLPLLRMDIGRMFSSLVGSSEENIRQAVRIAESISPCILWVDEIDKAFAAMSGGSTDSGTSQRVLGTFLTWMAEKTSAVFVVATANNIRMLPPELMRKGRFDELFFVDLPNRKERREILRIHLGLRKRNPEKFDLDRLAGACAGFSGSEIEQAIVSALFDAFHRRRDLEEEDLMHAFEETTPLSRTMEEEIKALREWCLTRTRPASLPQEAGSGESRGRKLEIQ